MQRANIMLGVCGDDMVDERAFRLPEYDGLPVSVGTLEGQIEVVGQYHGSDIHNPNVLAVENFGSFVICLAAGLQEVDLGKAPVSFYSAGMVHVVWIRVNHTIYEENKTKDGDSDFRRDRQ